MHIATETKGILISNCYVITWTDHGMFTCESTIYLSYPTHVGPYESVHEFTNVFDAKKFINSHVLPGARIKIAA